MELADIADESFVPARLMGAAARARERRDDSAVAPSGDWKSLFYKATDSEVAFLNPFMAYERPHGSDGNYVLVLKGSRVRDEHLEFVNDSLDENPHGAFLVALLDKTGEPLSPRLKALCVSRGLGLVQCRGLFELNYLLQRTRETHRGMANGAVRGTQFVRVSPNPRFAQTPPRVLITHSFVHGSGDEACIEAARFAHELTQELPYGTVVSIHPAVDCALLLSVVSSIQLLTAWVHIGRDEQEAGLQVSGHATQFKSPSEWLACFGRYAGSLALACFPSPGTMSVASHFAKAGVGVAVGFDAAAPLRPCRTMTRDVLRAALASGGTRSTILAAFGASREHLGDADHGTSWATAFCAQL
jgi:hypothetical protein